MTALRDALAFLTRLPVGLADGHGPARMATALVWFPAIGLLVGAVVGGVRLLAEVGLTPGPATVLALAAGVLLTGALHEDGLADTADGLGARATRERRLEIMRDPRVGSYGALALVGWALLAWSLLAALDGVEALRAAIAAHVLARWAILPQSLLLAPARADGVASGLRATPAVVAAGSATAAATAVLAVGPLPGLAVVIAAAAVAAGTGLMVRRTIGGVTGDTYGLTVKAVELAALAIVAGWWT